jgi:Holliday junction resolvase-like predicted endonuclease
MDKKAVGSTGEDLACGYLEKNGYKIISRNYRMKFGELDIIAESPDKTLVFFEVKTSGTNRTASCFIENSYPQISGNNVNKSWIIRQLIHIKRLVTKPNNHQTLLKSGNNLATTILPDEANPDDGFIPEDQMSKSKINKFKRVALWYANQHPELVGDKGHRLDVVAIELGEGNYRLRHYRNIQ